ncbi:cytochrome c biogenesis protein CcsA [Neisseria sp. ZJ106]|uniref:Cytochrome c biogenesis protein CcsA n=1 Tax=Neisseria lisongii TaxID=2912188 RepID=A0AAW5AQC3_9NEIS|nr:cytochrome c biogenesis protein CcsA [Neisseria lisongii]MCF7521994.1 cytochrome c biogenesis protein CcsA [Neisseria lisongii]MCF7530133.1 cytochrome c biogenesis protein CcsA [Neisseria lisongii]WCL71162.1 cytochrome c biogenesis protein CcsA [Neisseria lisongii]
MPIVLICLIAVYAALSAFVWTHHKKYGGKRYPLALELGILGAALLAHGAALMMPVLQDHILITGFGYSVSLIVWLMLMLYFAGSFFYCLRGLQLLLYPCATLMMLLGLIFPGKFVGYQISDLPFMLHIGTSLLAYGLFGIVTLFAVLILLLNRSLHKRRFSTLANFLPPLLSLEKIMFRTMLAGFVLLTYSVVSGTFFSESVFGKPFVLTHKTVFSIISWLIYAALLLKHSMMAWRGKKAAIWTIIGFASLVLAYVGSKFVLEVILHR